MIHAARSVFTIGAQHGEERRQQRWRLNPAQATHSSRAALCTLAFALLVSACDDASTAGTSLAQHEAALSVQNGFDVMTTETPRVGAVTTVAWSAPAGHAEGDWIALYPKDATEDLAYVAIATVGHADETSGEVQLALPAGDPGPFEVRYLLENSYTLAADTELQTRPIGAVSLSVLEAGQSCLRSSLSVEWTAPADHAEGDWIALYPEGATDDLAYIAFAGIGRPGEQSGRVLLEIPTATSGPLVVRYMLENSYTLAATTPVPATLPGSLEVAICGSTAADDEPDPTEGSAATEVSGTSTTVFGPIGASGTLGILQQTIQAQGPVFTVATIDLIPTGVMRYETKPNGIAGLMINVANIGQLASAGGDTRVSINGQH